MEIPIDVCMGYHGLLGPPFADLQHLPTGREKGTFNWLNCRTSPWTDTKTRSENVFFLPTLGHKLEPASRALDQRRTGAQKAKERE